MGIRIKLLFSTLLTALGITCVYAGTSLSEKIDEAYYLLDEQPEAASAMLIELNRAALNERDYKSAVDCNYILAWHYENINNPGKAIIYYLEGVRYAEHASYDGVADDLSSMLLNIGSIFLLFDDKENALNYYHRGMAIASEHSLFDTYVRLLLGSAQIHRKNEEYDQALALLTTATQYFNELHSERVVDIYNELGLVYGRLGQLEKALYQFDLLIQYVANRDNVYQEYTATALHNKAHVLMATGDYASAYESYSEALEFLRENSFDNETRLLTITDMGECALKLGMMSASYTLFSEAESLIDDRVSKPQAYRLYKLISKLHLLENNVQQYTAYQELYGTTMESYLAQQRIVEAEDKRYNLELITTRYHKLVQEQQKTQELRQYAQIGGIGLITVILTILGYYRYSRYRLRRDLEESLRPYAETVYIE